jgi:tRNA-uridine 2-sulfurtransferase
MGHRPPPREMSLTRKRARGCDDFVPNASHVSLSANRPLQPALASLSLVLEVIGDSARGSEYALVRLTVDGDRIVDADAPGLARPLEGLTLLEAAAVPGETLAADALANALAQVFVAGPRAGRVAVAMSGGVDSAVALLRSAPNAIGVTLRLWLDPAGPDAERACCSPQAVIAARETCHALGLPHVTLDLRDAFRRAVVDPFVQAYTRGDTPNPCGRCNGSFRFAELLAFARRAGAERLVTGHYVRVTEHRGRTLLARAADETKDQSYMLATLDPRLLDRISFPLGGQGKSETRAEAAAAGLAVAQRRESQEACFLAGGDYRDFLERQGHQRNEGPIVDEAGHELGRHDGTWRYTPGQRRGIGVAAQKPLYALRANPRTNVLVVGPREALASRHVSARGRLHVPVTRAHAKLRYRSPSSPAAVTATSRGFRLVLDEPAYAVACGQIAALYEGDALVGAGTVTSSGGASEVH